MNIPELYSFSFAHEHSLPNGESSKNAFQIKIKAIFFEVLLWRIHTIPDKEFRVRLYDLLNAGIPFEGFSLVNKTENYYIYLELPRFDQDKDKSFSYLQKQASFIASLLSYFHYTSVRFSASPEGKKSSQKAVHPQQIIPTVIAKDYQYHFSCQIVGFELLKFKTILSEEHEVASREVLETINELLTHDFFLQQRTRVSLKKEYVQIEIFGEYCSLITDFSSGNDPAKTLIVSGRGIDTPLQFIVLLAAAGTLFRLAAEK